MKLVYTHENRFLVGNAFNLLEREGFAVVMKNDFAAGASGELGFMDVWPEVWVLEDDDEMRAKEFLSRALSESDAPEWQCHKCGEHNAQSFEVCWQCGEAR